MSRAGPAAPARSVIDWVLGALLAMAIVMTSPAAAGAGPLTSVASWPSTGTTAPSWSYDGTPKPAAASVAHADRSSDVERPAAGASGSSRASSAELVAPKGSPSLWSRLTDETGSIPGGSAVDDVFSQSQDWLGPNWRVINNQAGDTIVLSDDGLRRLRFDINRPYPHSSPHAHVEELVNGRWVKSGPLYPTDVPPG